METNEFLPDTYEVPRGESHYFKFEQGDNKFRVLDKPVFGWEAWTKPDAENPNGKPVRFTMDNKPTDLSGFKDQKIAHMWIFPVWSFQTKSVQVLQLTQKSLMKAIEALARNEDWGSPLRYNITVRREGEKLDTEYFVNPSPHSDVPAEAQEAWRKVVADGFDITRLFSGGDPFQMPSQEEAGEGA